MHCDNLPTQTDVLIVGAGPTGLALALQLQQAGVDYVLVERLAAGQNTSRAAVIHAHTLEVLETLGVTERLLREGLQLSKVSIRDRDRLLTRLRFDTLPTRYPCILLLPQERTEAILADALEANGGRIRRNCLVESLATTAEGATATLVSGANTALLHARYVVGADGMHSIVRQSSGIGFRGGSYAESFVLADVDMHWAHGHDEVMLFFAPAGLVVVAPLPGDRFRIVATLDDAPGQPDIRLVQTLLDTRGPVRGAATVQRLHWTSCFHIHHRIAERYRSGSYLLAGDAAHVHSPAGGQGMNLGLIDACVLGTLLAGVLARPRDASQLDHYETLRRPDAEAVLQLAGRLTRVATARRAPARLLRNLALRAIDQLPAARRFLAMSFAGLNMAAAAEPAHK